MTLVLDDACSNIALILISFGELVCIYFSKLLNRASYAVMATHIIMALSGSVIFYGEQANYLLLSNHQDGDGFGT